MPKAPKQPAEKPHVIFGRNVKKVLERRSMSQSELAEQVGCTRHHINRVICGHTEPAIGTCYRIGRAIQVDLDLLLDFAFDGLIDKVVS